MSKETASELTVVSGGRSSGSLVIQTDAAQTIFEHSLLPTVQQRRASGVSETRLDSNVERPERSDRVPMERVYPHAFDEQGELGQVHTLLVRALNDAQQALEDFDEADLESVNTRLRIIAANMKNAHPLTEFNESLGAVVSYLRRGALVASGYSVTRQLLNALLYVLKAVVSNPMIDLEDAGDLIEKLGNEAWPGEHKRADELIAALLGDLEAEATQTELFPLVKDDSE